MMKTKKKQPIKHLARKQRAFVLAGSVLLTLLILISSTYAWVTLADHRVKHMEGRRVEIVLTGRQDPEVLTPAVNQSVRHLSVRNEGTEDAIVRVALSEVLLAFEVDVLDKTGNGHLKESASAAPTVIDKKDSTTWVKDATLATTSGQYLTGAQRVPYQWQQGITRPNALEQVVKLDMSTVSTKVMANASQPYWLFYEGYFYYSEKLKPGEVATDLVSHWNLSEKMPNRYKGSLYELQGLAHGYAASLSSVTNGYKLGTNTPVYQMMQEKL